VSFDGQPVAGPDQFTETSILYAIMREDPEAAQGLIAGMTKTELCDYYTQLSTAIDMVVGEMRTRPVRRGVIV
jgi:hypothetical protein